MAKMAQFNSDSEFSEGRLGVFVFGEQINPQNLISSRSYN